MTANGDYPTNIPNTTLTDHAGTYYWFASYSGDENNGPAETGCSDETEKVVVEKATPGLATQVSSATVTVGASISDAATLTGLISPSGGTVTFDLYKGADCSAPNKIGATLQATDNPVTANGTFHSPSVDTTTTGAGAYHWIAHYSGDANNNAANGACLDTNENTTVNKATPGLATQVSAATLTVGAQISDAATLTGLVSPSGGTVTFDLYKGTDCSAPNKIGATLAATDNPVTANGTFHSPSVDTTTTGAGAYHWIAHYSGDANNNAANGACLDTNENTTVNKATPGLATQVSSATLTVGASISDAATLTGLVSPSGGTVTFDLYKGTDCSAPNKVGATLAATDNPVTANGTFHSPSVDTTTTGAGAYHWIAHYSGDANNNAANGACLDTNENTTVEKKTPTLATQVSSATVTVGAQISDAATLTGLSAPAAARSPSTSTRAPTARPPTRSAPPWQRPTTRSVPTAPSTRRASTPPPPAPAPITGSPTTQAMPITTPPTAPASTPTRTRPSTKPAPASPPRSRRDGHRRRLHLRCRHPHRADQPQRRHGHFRPLQGHRLLGPQQDRRHPAGHRQPGRSQRHLPLAERRHHDHRRRRLPLDRPLLRRCQ